MTRTLPAWSLPCATAIVAASSPALAHPGPHHDGSIAEAAAHILTSADHLGMLAFATLCFAAAVSVRVLRETKIARAKAKSHPRSTRQ